MLEESHSGLGEAKSACAVFSPEQIWRGEYFSRVTTAFKRKQLVALGFRERSFDRLTDRLTEDPCLKMLE